MRRAALTLAAVFALGCGVGVAQVASYPPAAVPDLSSFATTAQVQALRGAMPSPCGAVPSPDTLNGALGVGTPCTARPDAARPTAVQAANVVTDGSGSWSVTWAKPFASSSPTVNPLPVNTGSLPIMCNVQTRSATSAAGRCWQANTNTLPGTVTALGGLVLNVFASGAANAPVMVLARDTTQ